jgi:hypothetical protein
VQKKSLWGYADLERKNREFFFPKINSLRLLIAHLEKQLFLVLAMANPAWGWGVGAPYPRAAPRSLPSPQERRKKKMRMRKKEEGKISHSYFKS